MNYFQEKTKKLNRRKQTDRYKAKRERRAYLTEAYNDGELALYKPDKPKIPYYKILAAKLLKWDEKKYNKQRIADEIKEREQKYKNMVTEAEPEETKPIRYNWFEKLLLKLKEIFIKLTGIKYD